MRNWLNEEEADISQNWTQARGFYGSWGNTWTDVKVIICDYSAASDGGKAFAKSKKPKFEMDIEIPIPEPYLKNKASMELFAKTLADETDFESKLSAKLDKKFAENKIKALRFTGIGFYNTNVYAIGKVLYIVLGFKLPDTISDYVSDKFTKELNKFIPKAIGKSLDSKRTAGKVYSAAYDLSTKKKGK